MPLTTSPPDGGITTVDDTTGWLPVTPVYRDQPGLTFPGEPCPARGLAIIPSVDACTRRYTGGWTVVHTQSGLHMALTSVPLVYAREYAALLAATGVDWTARPAELTDAARRTASMVLRVRDRVLEAWDAGAPAWWSRHSWRHVCPAWLVDTNEALGEQYQFDAWPELVAWLDIHHGDPWYRVEDISREPDATWRLTCAAPLCDHHEWKSEQPAVLGDADDDRAGGWYEIRHPDRATTAQAARDRGWTRHDRTHWLCPDCTRQHAPNPNADYGC
ncbi:hypothetical protein KIPE111705_36950 [Kibdelosporangium persicum]|uniref:Uncharacterized protein n=1 Tax=Kibdelosporangium persicum TaxID=2698649 RepID=A0ABX2F3Y4_9PSEU|nr:hypothetical protein [Kibdelosporangium persicum]NRN65898.1 hypothetical protein [Kibdelosporangium persicum]